MKRTAKKSSRSAPKARTRLDNEPRSFSLAGRTALITGSSKGLGRAMALALGDAGARVAMNYANNKESADATLADFRRRGYEGEMFRADVTSARQVERLVGSVEKKLGKVDVLVVNATPDQPQKPIESYDWDFYQSMLDFFVKSPFLLTRAVLPSMKRRRFGRIINIGSEVFRLGVSPFSAYVAAKGAQTGWTRSMANELAPWQITVNMVSPGWIPVERHDKDPISLKNSYKAKIPLQRWGVPGDVGGAIVFLASDAAAFVTGQDFAVNGGMTVT